MRNKKYRQKNQHGIDKQYYESVQTGSLAEQLMIRARQNIFTRFLQSCAPTASDTILDVGVSDAIESGDNMLERLYAHQSNITAAGLGAGIAFKANFPKTTYQQIFANQPLPFPDKKFSIAASNAVLEHVGSPVMQKFLIEEMLRIAGRVFITIPNRYFPVEHHTALPFVAWNDCTFKFACNITGKHEWAKRENLILMSMGHLRKLIPESFKASYGYTGIHFGPFSSNIYAVITAL